jgi:peptide/nickel transport system permease protein
VPGAPLGYFGGWLDSIVMRFNDALLASPMLVLAIAISGALGPGTLNVMIAVMVVSTPAFARLVRGEALLIRQLTYVEAARVLGCGPGNGHRW